jgi:hypothetical protein
MKTTRRRFMQASAATTIVAAAAIPAVLPDEKKIRVITGFEILDYDGGHTNRAFRHGDILTKADVDTVPGYPEFSDLSEPGFFEMAVEKGVAEYV